MICCLMTMISSNVREKGALRILQNLVPQNSGFEVK